MKGLIIALLTLYLSCGVIYAHELFNPHNGERAFLSENLDWFMRDWRRASATPMDPQLTLLLETIYERFEDQATGPMWLLSGYRTKPTNDLVGGADHSFHMLGQAADIRIPGVSTYELWRAALEINQYGGVGYYPEQGFVHVDTGPRRRWTK